ncbi:uncharacterized protein LOC106096873 isoform X2 [Oreochromis niloticus]|uniref:uncharacterized protein LOC106096873 isoform X2 n=1 Tax=Oreochromis niloticus TaxID=8128 RepID=UPI000DF4AF13|nr:uncharacterized protein LOC106096873 isoform X2 [Oreochromis niloticus]
MLQETDPVIREFLQFWRLRRGPDAKERGRTSRLALGLVRQWRRLVEQGGVLYRKVCHPRRGETLQVLLPKSLQGQVLQHVCQEHGHQGVRSTVDVVSQWCYWVGMYRDVQRWCQECERCQSAQDAPTQPKQIPVAEWRKTRHDQQAKDAPLREGQLVYLKKVGLRGRDKIKGASSSVVYKVLKAPDQNGSVYTTTPVEEPMQDGEWFLLVSEPTPAPSSCQQRPETPSPRRSDELEPSTSSAGSACPDQLPVMAGVHNDIAPLRRTNRGNAGTHPNPHHLPQAAGSRAIEAVNSQAPVPTTVTLFRPW